ncbi:MAG TPA: DUF2007 domain-containing protein [Mycobacteriales bacterium]|nr:DUF2007 domain-containing protein [Mycobacteriales bacterium]
MTAAVFHTEAEARLVAGALENAGISATVRSDNPDYGAGFVEASRVIVRRRNLEAARSIMQEIEAQG